MTAPLRFSIPFNETRDYVKKVLANGVLYARQFGTGGPSLKQRLAFIPPRGGKLDSTDHPVSRVATLSGFHNMANFNRQFLAEVGSTPSAYRRLETSQKPPNEVISLGLRATRAAEPPSGPPEQVVQG